MFSETPLVVLITVVAMTTVATADIFTSSLKVERMVMEEEQLLREFKRYIDIQYDRLKAFSNFYSDRLRDVRLRQKSDINLKHPNAVYQIIKRFATDYAGVLGDHYESFRVTVEKSDEQFLSDGNDIRGARLSLLRLQNVYNLNAMDMARGDYLGYQGPQLEAADAYEIAQTAFTEGKLNQSLEWLNVSLTLHSHGGRENDGDSESKPSLGVIKALLGRVHLFNGSPHLAEALYYEAKQLDHASGDVLELSKELLTQPRLDPHPLNDQFRNFSRLCNLENGHQPAESNSPSLFCRYREAVLPYYRFQEEILSVEPFASVFYQVISDEEGNSMRALSETRAWIYDADSIVATAVAKRIECITGLDTSQRLPDGPTSGEAFQVVNYGLGGHYEVHMDPFETPTTQKELQHSGERIATFLIYLSDVEKGGSTVFTRVGLSVTPKKNMALMWYSYTPAHQRDELTHHAGCPVLIGQKWIVNKWIWTYGNTFRRRCGLRPDATQLDIEPDMRRGYK